MQQVHGQSSPPGFPASSPQAIYLPWAPDGVFQSGKATHYGPYPNLPSANEGGYQKNDVGVGCSTGVAGGDPNWNRILSHGRRQNPLNADTVWPLVPTIAVSEAAWNRKAICWQTLSIRSRADHSKTISAIVVDFCPTKGCLWNVTERAFNVDLYGQESWYRLGGDDVLGHLDIEVSWPKGLEPLKSSSLSHAHTIYTFLYWFINCI